uniref:Uncharacterized protein n=1 Tax=Steinernema glaseri TaxID=37863 RepID=A0A1I7Y968_9BILA
MDSCHDMVVYALPEEGFKTFAKAEKADMVKNSKVVVFLLFCVLVTFANAFSMRGLHFVYERRPLIRGKIGLKMNPIPPTSFTVPRRKPEDSARIPYRLHQRTMAQPYALNTASNNLTYYSQFTGIETKERT